MAKCVIMRDGEYANRVIRVPDDYAYELVSNDRAEYVSKEIWKEAGRSKLKKEGVR